ncbi:RHS repeat-associated core domain-containing protein [Amycolatopsis taiwanensis]|uniref:RHS repeat-associated core domain-containing protein n=1 Tax=Amycolatopsis taiwanensis TaxID=342230 RepID=UPI0004B0C619|nr:RHS repeat-associated core domain-containing protein [Amycolatopsis taiwanensis]
MNGWAMVRRFTAVAYGLFALMLVAPPQASAACGPAVLQSGSSPLGDCPSAPSVIGIVTVAALALGGVGLQLAISLGRAAATALRDGVSATTMLAATTAGPAASTVTPARPPVPTAASTPAAVRCTAGDPVDVATGEVLLRQTDVELPGVLPLVLTRTHLSSYRSGLGFGRSWADTLSQRVEFDGYGLVYVADDGMRLIYPVPPATGAVLPAQGPRWPLVRTPTGFAIHRGETGQTLHFRPVTATVLPLAIISDRNGNTIEVDRDAAGAPTAVRHSGGYHIDVDIENGLVTELRLRDARGPATTLLRYTYDAGQLSEVINESGTALRFTYDTEGRITGWTDRNGEWYRWHYDSGGRCVAAEGSGGFLNGTFTYDTRERTTRFVDALGAATGYRFDRQGRLIAETDPLGRTTTWERDRHGRVVSTTDPLGRTTRHEYDVDGNLIRTVRPDGSVVRIAYDQFGFPAAFADPDGAIWRCAYDQRGNLLTSTDPSGATTYRRYDEHGRLVGVLDPLGGETRIDNDPAGLPVAVTDPAGRTTRYFRDHFGRPAAVIDPLGRIEYFGWTVAGRALSHTHADGTTEQWRYDREGNQVGYTDRLGRQTRTEVTHFDLPAEEITPGGARTRAEYDHALRLVSVIDPAGATWRFSYDAAGNVIGETDLNGRTLEYRYDEAGRLIEQTSGAGETVRFDYDALDRVVERRAGEGVTHFEYDAAGRLVRAVNEDADVRLQRDALGRVVAESVNGRTIHYGYDSLGRRVFRRTPAGTETGWSYDPSDRPLAMRLAGQTVWFSHDAAGRVAGIRWSSGLTLTRSWDAADRLVSETVGRTAPTLQRHYRYRPDGHLLAMQDALGTRQFTLDEDDRVTNVDGPAGRERYAYDAAGNIVDALRPWPGAEEEPREYSGTLIRAAGEIRYEHDAQGRTVLRQRNRADDSPETWRFSWNSDDQLQAVTTPDGTRWCYRYDPFGRRIAKQRLGDDGTVVEQIDFVWDGSLLVEQIDSSGRVTTWEYAPDDAGPLVQLEHGQGGQRCFAVLADPIGAPTELVDLDGTVRWRATTSLWGEAPPGEQARIPLRFPGQYHDPETGLHYNVFRYYEPETGRYLTADPRGLDGGLNPHAYVANPLAELDPLGLTPEGPDGCAQRGGQPSYEDVKTPFFADQKGQHRAKSAAHEKLSKAPYEPKHRYAEPRHAGRYQPQHRRSWLRSITDRNPGAHRMPLERRLDELSYRGNRLIQDSNTFTEQGKQLGSAVGLVGQGLSAVPPSNSLLAAVNAVGQVTSHYAGTVGEWGGRVYGALRGFINSGRT